MLDNILTLLNLIQQEVFCRSMSLFMFCWFRKAFNTVLHDKLWERLQQLGVPIHSRKHITTMSYSLDANICKIKINIFGLIWAIPLTRFLKIKPRNILPMQRPNWDNPWLWIHWVWFPAHMGTLNHQVKAKNCKYEGLDGHLKERSVVGLTCWEL